jgi:hypothetical protein
VGFGTLLCRALLVFGPLAGHICVYQGLYILMREAAAFPPLLVAGMVFIVSALVFVPDSSVALYGNGELPCTLNFWTFPRANLYPA